MTDYQARNTCFPGLLLFVVVFLSDCLFVWLSCELCCMAPTCWRTLPCVTVAISVFPLVLVHIVDVCSALQCVMRLRIHVRNGSGLACLNACFLCFVVSC